MSESSALPASVAVGIIGAGAMGSGIAAVAASAGHRVLLHDADARAIERALGRLASEFDRQVEKGRLSAEESSARLARIHAAETIEALAPCGLVIEAIVENLDVKGAVLKRVEAVVGLDAILGTNTSSISVTAIGAHLARPERLVGMHFFNPAQVLPLVEVVSGKVTDPVMAKTIFDTAEAWKKVPVHCVSTPGFIVNRVARPFYGEALRLLSEGAGEPATVDAILRDAGGFRMGAFELMDMIGHDVNYAVTCSVYDGFYQDPRFTPSLLQKELVDAGWLGRKSGRGFYDHTVPAPPAADALPAAAPLQLTIEGDLGCAAALAAMATGAGIVVERIGGSGALRVGGVRVALTDGRTATERAAETGEPFVLFDLALDYASCTRIALAAADQTNSEQLAAVVGFFQRLGKVVSVIDDAPGMVVMRTVAMLANEAADTVQQRIASARDVDLAMRKGVNYPLGPLAWADAIGVRAISTVLENLAAFYGQDRYRLSPLLRRRALANQSLAG
ncbi:3-hydroxyacyl-CoA dehydrogenase PaaH [Massilia sp. LXY-6]|uniref:3-hydroxyacyl-CoA dehydrogenase PaaH n=1 Tax=Massilia sp. LXY-6 TaxID=3379823 RepID=UPI003EE36EC7